MYHTIEFADEMVVDLEISPRHWLEQMLIRRGTRLQAQIKPYVVETADGLVEVADHKSSGLVVAVTFAIDT
jgi:hypothetical protein